MKRFVVFLLLFSIPFATIITVDDDGPADYSSGVYFVKMISKDFVSTQKLMLIK